MKKGFTLMEMLAVVLLLVLVVSFAAPVYRSIRFDVRNAQAKTAAKKLAEAVKHYFKDSRGVRLSGCFTPGEDDDVIQTAATDCNPPGAVGSPATDATQEQQEDVGQLFACGYLSHKDFIGLPYTFCTAKIQGAANFTDPQDLRGGYFAVAFSNNADAVGSKYIADEGFVFVDARMDARDTYDD